MNTVWILLWMSSAPLVSNGEQIAIQWEDRYSIRHSSAAAVEWMETLKKHGKGFNFSLYESKLVKEDLIEKTKKR